MADDKRLATEALSKAQTTCKDALSALHEPIQESSQDLVILYKDLLSFFKLLRASTTKVALSLKPASPTYKASLSPLKDVSDQVAGLTHCVRLFHPSFGKTLQQEVIGTTEEIIRATTPFLQCFIEEDRSDSYLARIGTVHDLIDKACLYLSRDNASAVQKKWKQNQESLEDGMSELEEILEAGNDDVDDGWDELGLGDEEITQEEIDRTKKIQTVLRLSITLHRRISSHILSSERPLSSANLQDNLLNLSTRLLEASDDVVAALHPKQDIDEIVEEMQSYQASIQAIRSVLPDFYPQTLESAMESMKLESSSSSKKSGLDWFNACFQQIDKAIERTNILPSPDGSTS